jgi:hypothetical protein
VTFDKDLLKVFQDHFSLCQSQAQRLRLQIGALQGCDLRASLAGCLRRGAPLESCRSSPHLTILGQQPQLTVECSPVEPVWLQILVGFHAIDNFAQFVEIADSLAIIIGIEKPPHGFTNEVQLLESQMASVPIQPLEAIQGPSADFGQRRSASADA